MDLHKAQRRAAKIKLAIQGPSGSGKTMSSLLMASGMTDWSKIAVIDTENHSADLYSHLGDYNVLQLEKLIMLESYIKAIEVCEKTRMEVILIDSVFTRMKSEFAQIIGRAWLYQNMPYKEKNDLPQFPSMDSQANLVVKDYYSDESFCRNDMENINLWKLFNLFTGATKMSYIDTFLDRGIGCQQFVNVIYQFIGESKHHWFVS